MKNQIKLNMERQQKRQASCKYVMQDIKDSNGNVLGHSVKFLIAVDRNPLAVNGPVWEGK